MRRTLNAGLLALLAVLALVPRATGQIVALRPTLEPGRVMTYEASRTFSVVQHAAGNPTQSVTSSLDLVVQVTVGSVRADGTVQLGIEFQSIAASVQGSGPVQKFVHPAAAPAEEQPEIEAAAPSGLEVAGAALAAAKGQLTVDREGRPGDLNGLDALTAAIEGARKKGDGSDAAALAGLTSAAVYELLTPIFRPAAPEAPGRQFRDSESWTTERRTGLASLGDAETKEAWTLSRIGDGTDWKASAKLTVSVLPPRGIVSAAPRFALSSGTGSAELGFDGGSGAVDSFSRVLEVSGRYSLGELTMEQTQRSSVVIKRMN